MEETFGVVFTRKNLRAYHKITHFVERCSASA